MPRILVQSARGDPGQPPGDHPQKMGCGRGVALFACPEEGGLNQTGEQNLESVDSKVKICLVKDHKEVVHKQLPSFVPEQQACKDGLSQSE